MHHSTSVLPETPFSGIRVQHSPDPTFVSVSESDRPPPCIIVTPHLRDTLRYLYRAEIQRRKRSSKLEALVVPTVPVSLDDARPVAV